MNLQDMKENRSASVLCNENLQRYDPLVFSRQQKGMVGWGWVGGKVGGAGWGLLDSPDAARALVCAQLFSITQH